MRKYQHPVDALETALRQAAPALRGADPARVATACRRAENASGACFASKRESPHLGRNLARAAACLVLALGLAILMRTPSSPTRLFTSPISSAELADTLDSVVNAPGLGAALTTEANNLTDDFTNLTIAINKHTLSLIL